MLPFILHNTDYAYLVQTYRILSELVIDGTELIGLLLEELQSLRN